MKIQQLTLAVVALFLVFSVHFYVSANRLGTEVDQITASLREARENLVETQERLTQLKMMGNGLD